MSPKILLVEDNPATRKLVRFALGRRGYTVLEAPDARSALAAVQAERLDLILQDIVLPDMDGFTLIAELRRFTGDTPILAFSGYVSKLDEARISAVGFDDVIIKPIEPSQLATIVEAHLPGLAPVGERFGSGWRLLVADDEPVQLKLARFRLSRLGFQIETAANGEEALELARRSRPDAVVADVTMPVLDGFGLSVALRQDPVLRNTPLLLMTSSYVEPTDRDLARRSGATDLVQRTPELAALLEALRELLARSRSVPSLVPEALPALEQARASRALRQLERQVQLNSGLARRCSALAAELTVLAGISETVLNHRDLDSALDQALAACFDAGGISVGALYLLQSGGELRARTLGGDGGWQNDQLRSFFGHEGILRDVMTTGMAARVPSPAVPEDVAVDLLAKCGARTALIVPLAHAGASLGALVMMTREHEFHEQDWYAFAQGVCNQITQVLLLASAFSDKAAAEQKASEHAALLYALLESAPDLVLHVDVDGTIRFINRPFPGARVEQVIGSSWLEHQQPEQHEQLRDALASVIATGEPTSYETTGRGKNGELLWYSARLGPVRREGEIAGAVLILRDITDRKQTEAQLLVSDRMASVGTLAAGVAHEINNPLAAVLANLDLALRAVAGGGAAPVPGAELLDELREARTGAERVRQIVRDLKIFSRSEEDAHGPVNVERVIESTLRMASNEIRHRARLSERYGSVPPVEANESRLGQVFLNLIVNAAQAIPEGSFDENEIRIETATDAAGHVVVTIADTGQGIAPEVQQRIFTPFFTTKAIGVGTGLGLSICHRIVTSFGGTISFESHPGKGTAFRVVLPAAREPLPESVPRIAVAEPALRRGRILVVDDEDAIPRAVARILGAEHDVTGVTNGRAALELIEGGAAFDLILCDLMMPQMTGMDVFSQIKERRPELAGSMVFLTGGAFTQRAREFLVAVPNRRIEKPFDAQFLRALVNEWVR